MIPHAESIVGPDVLAPAHNVAEFDCAMDIGMIDLADRAVREKYRAALEALAHVVRRKLIALNRAANRLEAEKVAEQDRQAGAGSDGTEAAPV